MLKLKLYIPYTFKEDPSVERISELLKKLKRQFKSIDVEKIFVDEDGEKSLKSKILWGLSVSKGIKIKQTRKSKSLYPQLLLFIEDRPITFYPQSRGSAEITIEEFIKGLLNGNVKCLHNKYEIEQELRGGKYEGKK